jgi:hypothetical protein
MPRTKEERAAVKAQIKKDYEADLTRLDRIEARLRKIEEVLQIE